MKWEIKKIAEGHNSWLVRVKGITKERWQICNGRFIENEIEFVLYNSKGITVRNFWIENIPEGIKKRMDTEHNLFSVPPNQTSLKNFQSYLEDWLNKTLKPLVEEAVEKHNIDDWLEKWYKIK